MNRYGEMLMDHLRRTEPQRLAQIPDPVTYFTERGQELESEILTLADVLAGPDRPGESYLAKTARLSSARFNAESDLTRQYLAEEGEEEEPLPAQWQPLSRADPTEDDVF